MPDAHDLAEFLPFSFSTPTEQQYVDFLWEAFEANYNAGKYQFAFLVYHMMMMSFIYFTVWQIRKHRPDDFAKATIGFGAEIERNLTNAGTPFDLSVINESGVVRFLKLIGCDNSKIGVYAKLVRDRNEAAHANGNIRYGSASSIDAKIDEILRAVSEIQTHSTDLTQQCYRTFLIESHDEDLREHLDVGDQIREVLIHGNYLSRKNIDNCISYDVRSMQEHDGFDQIQSLHQSLCELYGTDDA